MPVEKLLPGTRFLLDVQAGWAAAAAAAREARQRKRTFSLPFSRHNSRGSTGSSASSSSQEDSLSARSSASSQTSDRSSGARSLPGEDEPGKQAVLMFKRKIFLGEDLEGPGGDAPGTSEGDAVRMEARAFEYTQVRERGVLVI